MKGLKHHLNRLPAWLLTAVTVIIILWLTLMPDPLPPDIHPELFPGADKVVHGLMFGFLTFTALVDWMRGHGFRRVRWFVCLLSALAATLFGIGIEYAQRGMGLGRGFEVPDMLADGIGAFLVAIVWIIAESVRSGRAAGPSQKSGSSSAMEPSQSPETDTRAPKRHLIKPRWLRIPLKILMWIVIAVLFIPVLLYIPPVQDAAVHVAENTVYKSTGMEVHIGKFRLYFPLRVHLHDVYVLTSPGDTMVRAGEAIADVKLLPLIGLDVKVNQLDLKNGYYRMVSTDSSMVLGINAAHLTVDNKSSVNIAKSQIMLNKVKLTGGRVSLFMNVWKSKPAPPDTAPSTPFYIQANHIDMEDFQFGMSMLPTIDTLDMAVQHVSLSNGIVDLGKNAISWRRAAIADGEIKYISPTAEYVRTHPAPLSQPSSGPPMIIRGDSISVSGVSALYATDGVKLQPGFDPSYISVSDVVIGMRNFYNKASTVRLPLTQLQACERSGLQIVQGSGTVAIDSVGLSLDKVSLRTVFSQLYADADVPFAVMALDRHAPLSAKANGSVGLPDIEAFMPALKEFTSKIPARKPLDFSLQAAGTLSSINIPELQASMPGIFSLEASGRATNPMDYKRMVANLDFEGTLMDPKVAKQFLADVDMDVPAFHIRGTADANGTAYGADFKLTSTAGDVAADGRVALTPETYNVNAAITELNVGKFLPGLGIGQVSGTVLATGRGFNPLSGTALTDARVRISEIEYRNRRYDDIRLDALLHDDGNLNIMLSSSNPGLNLDMHGSGTIHPDDYTVDLQADIRDLDLRQLGFTDSICQGHGLISLAGNAQPGRWLYDVDLSLSDFDWNMNDTYIHLPAGIRAKVKADELSTYADIDSDRAYLHFESPNGMKTLVDRFSEVTDTLMAQVKRRNLSVEDLRASMPEFELKAGASGSGVLGQFLTPAGMQVDTVYARLVSDSIFYGGVSALGMSTGGIQLDTVWLNLKERGQLLDYRLHVGNRPGTFDEFARLNINGYVGNNRVSAFLQQHNIKNEQGYRLGLTAAVADSTISVHFTPLKATIAYLPWTLNSDNYIDYNFSNMKVDANLKAQSRESSIMARTEELDNGDEQLRLRIENLHIEDFLSMWMFAPPVMGTVGTDMTVLYKDQMFHAAGDMQVSELRYAKARVGDFDMNINGSYAINTGRVNADAGLKIDGRPVIHAYARMGTAGTMTADSIGVRLTRFPLKIANPFLGNMMVLSGYVNGDMRMDSAFNKPVFNGGIAMDSAQVRIPFANAVLKMDTSRITVSDNMLRFNKFDILAANKNPLTIDGVVDARKFNDIRFNVTANAEDMQLINSNSRSKGDLYGKIFVNLGATVRGPMRAMLVKANLNVLGKTDATYRLNLPESGMTTQTDEGVVKFVNLTDTAQVAAVDTVAPSMMNMQIDANVVISPGTHLQVLLSSNGTDKVQVEPSANLNYHQSFMGDMTMNGTLTLGNGFARYSVPVIGEKMFEFDPNSTITWNGAVMNPVLNVTATDLMKANVTQNGNSRLVNFLVTLRATNTLDRMNVAFDLSTNDDISIQNELQSMSADQRQTQAMNLLLYGQYTGQGGTKGNANIGGNMMYSFLESQLNSWAAKAIKGVDLSFGIDQYDKAQNGSKTTTTSYSYQVSKSLFNNRFKILVGGNYSTDQDPEENLAQNLVSDISFEYIIRQTETQNMSVQLFRHQGFESILEGEITEMGAAFQLKRKLGSLKSLFRKRRRKKVPATVGTVVVDSTAEKHGIRTQNAFRTAGDSIPSQGNITQ